MELPGSLLEMQSLRSGPRPTESEYTVFNTICQAKWAHSGLKSLREEHSKSFEAGERSIVKEKEGDPKAYCKVRKGVTDTKYELDHKDKLVLVFTEHLKF